MSGAFLDEAYWKEQFIPSAQIIEDLYGFLKERGAAQTKELAEDAVRSVLEEQVGTKGFRIYSPEQSYKWGEVIFFQTQNGPKFAEVLYVDSGHSALLGDHRIHYDTLHVRFKDDPYNVRTFVSNCPSLPLRFTGRNIVLQGECVTPAELETRFWDAIQGTLLPRLLDDSRFVLFKESWTLSEYAVALDEAALCEVARLLREKGKAPSIDIAKALFSNHTDERILHALSVSVAINLGEDKANRFILLDDSTDLVWALSPPPHHVVITLTQSCTSEGFLPLSRELEKMLIFYNLGAILTFKAYGDYEIRGIVDEPTGQISGEDISQWMKENALEAGSKIYIGAPELGSTALRLYTLLERQVPEKAPSEEGEKSRRARKFLRHRIYGALRQEAKFLHYKEITKLVCEKGTDVGTSTVEAILSSNTHLFARREPTRGLWGLKEWISGEPSTDVSSTSLVLTIAEEGWVRRVLEIEGSPLSAAQIASCLAELFQVRVEQVRALSVIEPADTQLNQLSDGRWILGNWIDLWSERHVQIEKKLSTLLDLENKIAQSNSELGDARTTIVRTEEMLSQLIRNAGGTKEKVRLIEAKIERSTSHSIGLEAELGRLSQRVSAATVSGEWLASVGKYSVVVAAVLIAGWVGTHSKLFLLGGLLSAVTSLGAAARSAQAERGARRILALHRNIEMEFHSVTRQRSNFVGELQSAKETCHQLAIQTTDLADQREAKKLFVDQLLSHLNELQTEVQKYHKPSLLSERDELERLLQLVS